MIGLADPDKRRALRAVVEAIIGLVLVALVWRIVGLLAGNPEALKGIANGCLLIIALGTLFYGAENVTRAFKITGPAGLSADFGADASAVTTTTTTQVKGA